MEGSDSGRRWQQVMGEGEWERAGVGRPGWVKVGMSWQTGVDGSWQQFTRLGRTSPCELYHL